MASAQNNSEKEAALASNKKASHDYHILETIECGLELTGTEVKSCRTRQITLADSYAKIDKGEAWLLNVHIAPYDHGNRFNHNPKRERRLLLHKREILKLSQRIKENGATLIPLRFYLKKGRVKVMIGLAKGKTHGDKRESLRKKEDDRETRRALSSRARQAL